MSLAQKQRSWETFPPKRRHHICQQQQKLSVPTPLRKADSFEGNFYTDLFLFIMLSNNKAFKNN